MFMSKFSCMALYYHMYDKQTNGLSVTKLDSIDQFYNRNFRNYLDNVSTSNIRYYGKLFEKTRLIPTSLIFCRHQLRSRTFWCTLQILYRSDFFVFKNYVTIWFDQQTATLQVNHLCGVSSQ